MASRFVTDTRLGVVTWLVAAAHEVPQELGDFGILVHSGWTRRAALAYNLASASTVLVGAVVAYALAVQSRWRCCWRLRPATFSISPWPTWSPS
jgi:zinc and cadmium transporter